MTSKTYDAQLTVKLNKRTNTNNLEAKQTDKRSIPAPTTRKWVRLPFSESLVLVTLGPHPNIAENCTALTARGTMKFIPNELFLVWLGNLSPRPSHQPKTMHSACIVQSHHLLRTILCRFNTSAPRNFNKKQIARRYLGWIARTSTMQSRSTP